jgi:L-amino acid N-acyltransferase YncA
MIRPAAEHDAPALARIYNQAMKPGIYATAFVNPVDSEDRVNWFRRLRQPFGAWVYESSGGDVIGWCSLGAFGPRPAYRNIAEVSAYVDENYRGGSVGGKLLACLVTQARSRGFRSLVSIAFEKNVVSISGCLEAGFLPMAALDRVATCASGYESVLWIQKDLSADDPPLLRRMITCLSIEQG